MSQTTLAIFGIGAAALDSISLIPYIRDIFRRKTRPERSSWWIWLVLMVISFAAQDAAGSTWTLFFAGELIIGNLIIAVLSIKYGYGRFRKRDVYALIFAMAGLLLWKATDSPLSALIVVIIVDLLGTVLTMAKTWRAPYSEDLFAWVLVSIGSVLGFLSVGALDLSRIIFPAYLVIFNSLLVFLIIYRRKWRSDRIKAGLEA